MTLEPDPLRPADTDAEPAVRPVRASALAGAVIFAAIAAAGILIALVGVMALLWR